MSNFVVSARKYRPVRFDEVVGQLHVSDTLKNALRTDHLAHAFLFCGPRGVGKTTCARILAKVLNCTDRTDDFEPCNECSSCTSFNVNASLNITELDAASNNSVDHIRALIEQVRFQPQQGKYKVFIIDEVHMLSQAAFNAFLKTLEEPPAYAIFILATTEKHKIIPTILSRCQIFDFKRIQVAAVVDHLQKICEEEGIEAEPDALHIIGQKADGALRDALSIFDRIVSFSGKTIRYEDVIVNLNVLDYDFYFRTVDALLTEDRAQTLLVLDEVLRKGFEPELYMNGLAEHLRNLLVCRDPATLDLLEVGERLQTRYADQARLAPERFLLTALNLCNDCDINYKLARNKRLHVEMSLLKMAGILRAYQLSEAQLAGREKKTPDPSAVALHPATAVAPAPHPATQPATAQRNSATVPATAYLTSTPLAVVAEPRTDEEVSPSDPATVAADPIVVAVAAPAKVTKVAPPPAHRMKSVSEADLLAEIAATRADRKPADEPIKQERLLEIWQQQIATADRPSLSMMMKQAVPEADGISRIRLRVPSGRTEATIRQETSLIERIKKELKRPRLEIIYELDESLRPQEETKVVQGPMSARDRYLALRETNPVIDELRKRFDLRPDE
ncbi:MAG: DNA polymerase III subunit gamma/tau [Saprospiraceae bacterium]